VVDNEKGDEEENDAFDEEPVAIAADGTGPPIVV